MAPAYSPAMELEVVIHTTWGGFGLTEKAQRMLAAAKGFILTEDEGTVYVAKTIDGRLENTWKRPIDLVERYDPALVYVVRELGEEAGKNLKVVTFTVDVEIENNDGLETARVYGSPKI